MLLLSHGANRRESDNGKAVQMKKCNKCGEIRPLDQFSTRSDSADGLRQTCKPCNRAYHRIYHAAHLDEFATYSRAWRQANPDEASAATRNWYAANRDKFAVWHRAHRALHPEKAAASHRAYYVANRESIAAKSRVYQAANPEQSAATGQRRRARRLGNGVFVVTAAEIAAMLSKPCYICGAPSEHVDQIMPIARGGRHSIGNLAGACAQCNQRKGIKFLIEHKRQMLIGTAV